MTTDLINQLAQTGILGLLLALAIVAIVFLYRENNRIQEKRISDLKEARDLIMEPLRGIQQTAEKTLQIVEALKTK